MKKFFITICFLFLSVNLFSLELNEVFTTTYRTGDQLEYPLRSKLSEYNSLVNKNNVIYKIIDSGNDSDFDVAIDNFVFRLKKGDKFQTFLEKKGTAENMQSYIITYTISEEIINIKNNKIEIKYQVTKVEKQLKKGLKGDYLSVDSFPWE